MLQRGDEGFLDRLLGEIEVTELADEGREGPAGLLAEDTIDFGARIRRVGGLGGLRVDDRPGQMDCSQIGRTSIEPCSAPGIFAASSRASSRSFASIR